MSRWYTVSCAWCFLERGFHEQVFLADPKTGDVKYWRTPRHAPGRWVPLGDEDVLVYCPRNPRHMFAGTDLEQVLDAIIEGMMNGVEGGMLEPGHTRETHEAFSSLAQTIRDDHDGTMRVGNATITVGARDA